MNTKSTKKTFSDTSSKAASSKKRTKTDEEVEVVEVNDNEEDIPDLMDGDDDDEVCTPQVRKVEDKIVFVHADNLPNKKRKLSNTESVSVESAFSTPIKTAKPSMVSGPIPGSKEYVLQRCALKGIK